MPRQKQEYSPKCQVKPNSKTETSTPSQRLNETAKMESANLPPKTNAKTHSKIKAKANFQTLDHRDQHTFQPNAKMNAKISAKTDQPLHRKTSPLWNWITEIGWKEQILRRSPAMSAWNQERRWTWKWMLNDPVQALTWTAVWAHVIVQKEEMHTLIWTHLTIKI